MMTKVLVGFWLGGMVGFFLAALLCAAKGGGEK